VLIVETIAKIRRKHFVEGHGIKRICRDMHLSRNTVRKVVRGGKTEFGYRRRKQPRPRLGAFEERLTELLKEDWKQPRKKRQMALALFEELRREGYEGAYDAIQRFVKAWREKKAGVPSDAYIPLAFAPGEAYQFDWSHEKVILGGQPQTVKVAHFRLANSRMTFVAAFPRETQEMLLEAHNLAFAFFGGVCRKGIYDNLSTAITKILKGKERKFNPRIEQMWSHFLVDPVACTPAAGWEKGQVENQVRNIRRWLFVPKPRFKDMEELNAWLESRCRELAATRMHPENQEQTIAEAFAEEKESLIPWPGPFEAYKEKECRVSSTSLVRYDHNHYSVDCAAAGRTATLRIWADRIQVMYEETLIADHPRQFGRGKTLYDPWHYLAVLERKPGALRNGAPFREWPLPSGLAEALSSLAQRPGGDRECVTLLVAAKDHGLEAVNRACLEAVRDATVRSEVILNLLLRARDGEEPGEVTIPSKLKLTEEPVADCGRYDQLLEACHASP